MISTIFKDKNKGFSEKTASIVIKITKGDKARSVGLINLNLSNYIENEGNQKKQKMSIEKCPDAEAYLEF